MGGVGKTPPRALTCCLHCSIGRALWMALLTADPAGEPDDRQRIALQPAEGFFRLALGAAAISAPDAACSRLRLTSAASFALPRSLSKGGSFASGAEPDQPGEHVCNEVSMGRQRRGWAPLC